MIENIKLINELLKIKYRRYGEINNICILKKEFK